MPQFHRMMEDRLRTVEQGADTVVWLALSRVASRTRSGQFFQGKQHEMWRAPPYFLFNLLRSTQASSSSGATSSDSLHVLQIGSLFPPTSLWLGLTVRLRRFRVSWLSWKICPKLFSCKLMQIPLDLVDRSLSSLSASPLHNHMTSYWKRCRQFLTGLLSTTTVACLWNCIVYCHKILIKDEITDLVACALMSCIFTLQKQISDSCFIFGNVHKCPQCLNLRCAVDVWWNRKKWLLCTWVRSLFYDATLLHICTILRQ